jgi:hypothetical protein
MALTQEQFETLPEYVKGDYVQHEGAYVPQAELKVKGLKSSLDNLGSKLKEIEAGKAAEIEAARAKGLEEAKTKGDVAEVEKRYQEQMEDAVKRAREDERSSVTKELSQKQADTKASGIADTIGANLAVDKDAAEVIAELIKQRVKVDPETHKEYFLDASGSALSVNRSEFEAMLTKEGKFKHLVKAAIATNGAGGANGSNSGGSASSGKGNLGGDRKAREAAIAQIFNLPT